MDYVASANAEHELAARAMLERMGAQGPTHLLREELRAAGVPEHRIAALYPYDFADFILAIKAASPAGFLNALAPHPGYIDGLTSSVRARIDEFPAVVQEELHAHVSAFFAQGSARADLHAHLSANAEATPGVSGRHAADAVIYVMLNMCWLANRSFNHAVLLSMVEAEDVHRAFLNYIDILLPQLKVQQP